MRVRVFVALNVTGTVARLAEPVIAPTSFVEVLRKKNISRLMKVDRDGIDFTPP
mgnify:CR=1 FL=1